MPRRSPSDVRAGTQAVIVKHLAFDRARPEREQIRQGRDRIRNKAQ
jgi:hypothetical protein